jgi:hypothetical protein
VNAFIVTFVPIIYLVKVVLLSQEISSLLIDTTTYILSFYVCILFFFIIFRSENYILDQLFYLTFFIFLINSLILCTIYEFTYGFFNRTMLSIVFNYVLGFTCIRLIYHFSQRTHKKFKFFYHFFCIISIVLFITYFSTSPFHNVFLKFAFSSDLISYQTLSGFSFRIYACIVFMFILLSRYNQLCKYCLLSFVVISLLCTLFSLFAGSKKEPFLFILSFIGVLYYTRSYKTIITIILISSPFLFFVISQGYIEKLLIYNHLEASILNRINFIFDNAILLLDQSMPFGIPNLDQTLGVDYLHSSLPSVLRVNGVLGFILFIIMLCLTFYRIRNHNAILLIFFLTFSLSIIATPYNWFVLWFYFGVCNAYPITNEKFINIQKYTLSYS